MHKSAQLLVLAAAALSPTNAVLYGDEIYKDVAGGKFWAFYSEGIAVIDPESCSIETTITTDHNGDVLPNAFNDGVYMQSKDDSEGYILIGSRVDESNSLGETVSHMFAVSTTDREVISKAEVGARVVHSYGVYPQNEFWMHSDANGLFYVIDLDDLTKTTHDDIEAKVSTASHGKLLWDEGAKLKDRGFATSTGEQFLFEIDLITKEQTMAYDYSVFDIEGCRGLHGIAYSDINEHVYAECSGGGGALEFDVSGGSIQFVQQFPEANGALYETPDGQFVVASSKGGNALYLFVPQGSGMKSSNEYTIPMAGRPSSVSFYTNKYDQIHACSPMTENLNQNQRREDGSIACGYYEGCTGAATAAEVDLGVCLHSDGEDNLKLMRVTSDASITGNCARCMDISNFGTDEDGGNTCTCTPHCGSCDPKPALSDADSGYMCVSLSAYVRNINSDDLQQPTLVPGTGGMMQGFSYGGDPECTFGRTYRAHTRGMQYDAAVANIPNHSIVIVDMDNMEKKCSVALPAAAGKVVYAPNAPVKRSSLASLNGSSSGATSSRSASLAIVFLVAAVVAMV